jgi:hypothetical protein
MWAIRDATSMAPMTTAVRSAIGPKLAIRVEIATRISNRKAGSDPSEISLWTVVNRYRLIRNGCIASPFKG